MFTIVAILAKFLKGESGNIMAPGDPAAPKAKSEIGISTTRIPLTKNEEQRLVEMFIQCIEIEGGRATLGKLSLLFCRSPFIVSDLVLTDYYGEEMDVWNLARPLQLRRFLLKHPNIFQLSGIYAKTSVRHKIPPAMLKALWYLKSYIVNNFGGAVSLNTLVEIHSKLPDSPEVRVIGRRKEDLTNFVEACYSVFKLCTSEDRICMLHVVGAKKTIEYLSRFYSDGEEREKEITVLTIESKMREFPFYGSLQIGDLAVALIKVYGINLIPMCRNNNSNCPGILRALYLFLVKFPEIFEVRKKDDDYFTARVFLLQEMDSTCNHLYETLQDLENGKSIRSMQVVKCLAMCITVIESWQRDFLVSLHWTKFAVCERDMFKYVIGSTKQDILNFLSLFPSVFEIKKGRLRLKKEDMCKKDHPPALKAALMMAYTVKRTSPIQCTSVSQLPTNCPVVATCMTVTNMEQGTTATFTMATSHNSSALASPNTDTVKNPVSSRMVSTSDSCLKTGDNRTCGSPRELLITLKQKLKSELESFAKLTGAEESERDVRVHVFVPPVLSKELAEPTDVAGKAEVEALVPICEGSNSLPGSYQFAANVDGYVKAVISSTEDKDASVIASSNGDCSNRKDTEEKHVFEERTTKLHSTDSCSTVQPSSLSTASGDIHVASSRTDSSQHTTSMLKNLKQDLFKEEGTDLQIQKRTQGSNTVCKEKSDGEYIGNEGSFYDATRDGDAAENKSISGNIAQGSGPKEHGDTSHDRDDASMSQRQDVICGLKNEEKQEVESVLFAKENSVDFSESMKDGDRVGSICGKPLKETSSIGGVKEECINDDDPKASSETVIKGAANIGNTEIAGNVLIGQGAQAVKNAELCGPTLFCDAKKERSSTKLSKESRFGAHGGEQDEILTSISRDSVTNDVTSNTVSLKSLRCGLKGDDQLVKADKNKPPINTKAMKNLCEISTSTLDNTSGCASLPRKEVSLLREKVKQGKGEDDEVALANVDQYFSSPAKSTSSPFEDGNLTPETNDIERETPLVRQIPSIKMTQNEEEIQEVIRELSEAVASLSINDVTCPGTANCSDTVMTDSKPLKHSSFDIQKGITINVEVKDTKEGIETLLVSEEEVLPRIPYLVQPDNSNQSSLGKDIIHKQLETCKASDDDSISDAGALEKAQQVPKETQEVTDFDTLNKTSSNGTEGAGQVTGRNVGSKTDSQRKVIVGRVNSNTVDDVSLKCLDTAKPGECSEQTNSKEGTNLTSRNHSKDVPSSLTVKQGQQQKDGSGTTCRVMVQERRLAPVFGKLPSPLRGRIKTREIVNPGAANACTNDKKPLSGEASDSSCSSKEGSACNSTVDFNTTSAEDQLLIMDLGKQNNPESGSKDTTTPVCVIEKEAPAQASGTVSIECQKEESKCQSQIAVNVKSKQSDSNQIPNESLPTKNVPEEKTVLARTPTSLVQPAFLPTSQAQETVSGNSRTSRNEDGARKNMPEQALKSTIEQHSTAARTIQSEGRFSAHGDITEKGGNEEKLLSSGIHLTCRNEDDGFDLSCEGRESSTIAIDNVIANLPDRLNDVNTPSTRSKTKSETAVLHSAPIAHEGSNSNTNVEGTFENCASKREPVERLPGKKNSLLAKTEAPVMAVTDGTNALPCQSNNLEATENKEEYAVLKAAKETDGSDTPNKDTSRPDVNGECTKSEQKLQRQLPRIGDILPGKTDDTKSMQTFKPEKGNPAANTPPKPRQVGCASKENDSTTSVPEERKCPSLSATAMPFTPRTAMPFVHASPGEKRPDDVAWICTSKGSFCHPNTPINDPAIVALSEMKVTSVSSMHPHNLQGPPPVFSNTSNFPCTPSQNIRMPGYFQGALVNNLPRSQERFDPFSLPQSPLGTNMEQRFFTNGMGGSPNNAADANAPVNSFQLNAALQRLQLQGINNPRFGHPNQQSNAHSNQDIVSVMNQGNANPVPAADSFPRIHGAVHLQPNVPVDQSDISQRNGPGNDIKSKGHQLDINAAAFHPSNQLNNLSPSKKPSQQKGDVVDTRNPLKTEVERSSKPLNVNTGPSYTSVTDSQANVNQERDNENELPSNENPYALHGKDEGAAFRVTIACKRTEPNIPLTRNVNDCEFEDRVDASSATNGNMSSRHGNRDRTKQAGDRNEETSLPFAVQESISACSEKDSTLQKDNKQGNRLAITSKANSLSDAENASCCSHSNQSYLSADSSSIFSTQDVSEVRKECTMNSKGHDSKSDFATGQQSSPGDNPSIEVESSNLSQGQQQEGNSPPCVCKEEAAASAVAQEVLKGQAGSTSQPCFPTEVVKASLSVKKDGIKSVVQKMDEKLKKTIAAYKLLVWPKDKCSASNGNDVNRSALPTTSITPQPPHVIANEVPPLSYNTGACLGQHSGATALVVSKDSCDNQALHSSTLNKGEEELVACTTSKMKVIQVQNVSQAADPGQILQPTNSDAQNIPSIATDQTLSPLKLADGSASTDLKEQNDGASQQVTPAQGVSLHQATPPCTQTNGDERKIENEAEITSLVVHINNVASSQQTGERVPLTVIQGMACKEAFQSLPEMEGAAFNQARPPCETANVKSTCTTSLSHTRDANLGLAAKIHIRETENEQRPSYSTSSVLVVPNRNPEAGATTPVVQSEGTPLNLTSSPLHTSDGVPLIVSGPPTQAPAITQTYCQAQALPGVPTIYSSGTQLGTSCLQLKAENATIDSCGLNKSPVVTQGLPMLANLSSTGVRIIGTRGEETSLMGKTTHSKASNQFSPTTASGKAGFMAVNGLCKRGAEKLQSAASKAAQFTPSSKGLPILGSNATQTRIMSPKIQGTPLSKIITTPNQLQRGAPLIGANAQKTATGLQTQRAKAPEVGEVQPPAQSAKGVPLVGKTIQGGEASVGLNQGTTATQQNKLLQSITMKSPLAAVATQGGSRFLNESPKSSTAKASPVDLKGRRLCFSKDGMPLYLDPKSKAADVVHWTSEEEEGEMMAEEEEKLFLSIFPANIQDKLHEYDPKHCLAELCVDVGRHPEVRCMVAADPTNRLLARLDVPKVKREVLRSILSSENLGPVSSDNRCGIEGTLHRISIMRNRSGDPIGITARYGRAVFGSLDMAYDLACSGRSILLLGSPGVGKTTVLRELSRVLSDLSRKRVLIVDTSNEIAGEGDVPHMAVGSSRRMMVQPRENQPRIMIEAVQNHNPEVIVIDEIGNSDEAEAARTIGQRGVQLIATAHGEICGDLIRNKPLWPLIGGIHHVILSAMEAKQRRSSVKTVSERQGPAVFDILIELQDRDCWVVYHKLEHAVDCILRRKPTTVEYRRRVYHNGEKIVLVQTKVIHPEEQ